MKTIKLPFIASIEAISIIQRMRCQQSKSIRFAYNRLNDGLTRCECYHRLTEWIQRNFMFDSWCILSSVNRASVFSNRANIVFGGKRWLKLRSQGKITSEKWKERRLYPLYIEGDALRKGNRKFLLDILNGKIVFNPWQGCKHELKLPHLKKSYLSQLMELQSLTDQNLIPYTVELTAKTISISFETNEKERLLSVIKRSFTKASIREAAKRKLEALEAESNNLKKDRILGLDLNPNYIGLSILQFNDRDEFKILHKEVISFRKLNSKESYNNDKKRHEAIEACKHIVQTALHWKCGKVAIEDLTIQSLDKKSGRNFNRLCNNVWHRNLIINQIEKRSEEAGIEIVRVNAAYSSTVGNIQHGCSKCPDMVASAIEIARRAHKKFSKGWFYPSEKNIESLRNLWKEDLDWSSMSWKEIHSKIKESKVRYRFPLEEAIPDAVLSLSSYKSYVNKFSYDCI